MLTDDTCVALNLISTVASIRSNGSLACLFVVLSVNGAALKIYSELGNSERNRNN
jgi:hypothetical protein